MQFSINYDLFSAAVTKVADLVLNVTQKVRKELGYYIPETLTINASPSQLTLSAYNGMASIHVTLSQEEGYVCQQSGIGFIEAQDLKIGLASLSHRTVLYVSMDKKIMKLSLDPDFGTWNIILCSRGQLQCPKLPQVYNQDVTVNRAPFLKSIKKVMFAMQPNLMQSHYMCILFECRHNHMRFTASNGGRFAVCDISNLEAITIASNNDIRIALPGRIIRNLVRIFDGDESVSIEVKTAETDEPSYVPEQIVVKTKNVIMAIYGLDSYPRYPDINPVLTHGYTYQISTCPEDWYRLGKKLRSIRGDNAEALRNTKFSANLRHGYFDIQTNSEVPLNERIDFTQGMCVNDTSKGKDYQPWVVCNSDHIEEIARKGHKETKIILKFEDQALAPHYDDRAVALTPALFEFPPKLNPDQSIEKYLVFCVVSSRW